MQWDYEDEEKRHRILSKKMASRFSKTTFSEQYTPNSSNEAYYGRSLISNSDYLTSVCYICLSTLFMDFFSISASKDLLLVQNTHTTNLTPVWQTAPSLYGFARNVSCQNNAWKTTNQSYNYFDEAMNKSLIYNLSIIWHFLNNICVN